MDPMGIGSVMGPSVFPAPQPAGVVMASSSPRSPNQNQDWSIRRPTKKKKTCFFAVGKKHATKRAKRHEFEHVFFLGGKNLRRIISFFFVCVVASCRFANSRHIPK